MKKSLEETFQTFLLLHESCKSDGRIGGNLFLGFLGEDSEEVAMQDDGDAHQQLGVDVLATEDVVNIGAVAVQFTGQP